jgi:transposase
MIGGLLPGVQVFVVTGNTDMRKSYNGLAGIVDQELKMDSQCGHIFCFSNRRRDRLKLLVFDGSGLWVCAKKLEKGTFAWPKDDASYVSMTAAELTMLLGGFDVTSTARRRWYRRPAQDIDSVHREEEKLEKLLLQY